jgi:hypothetical protein
MVVEAAELLIPPRAQSYIGVVGPVCGGTPRISHKRPGYERYEVTRTKLSILTASCVPEHRESPKAGFSYRDGSWRSATCGSKNKDRYVLGDINSAHWRIFSATKPKCGSIRYEISRVSPEAGGRHGDTSMATGVIWRSYMPPPNG